MVAECALLEANGTEFDADNSPPSGAQVICVRISSMTNIPTSEIRKLPLLQSYFNVLAE
jgi:hypothetical protein